MAPHREGSSPLSVSTPACKQQLQMGLEGMAVNEVEGMLQSNLEGTLLM